MRQFQRALLPPHCLLCGQRSDTMQDLCAACAKDLSRNRSACARCALPLPTPAALCGECLHRAPPFDAALVPFLYGHPLDMLMTQFKFGHSLAAGRVLAELLIAEFNSGALPAPAPNTPTSGLPDLILPVPLHPARLRERGYNQALELCKPLARALHVKLAPDLLLRNRDTPAQSNLDAKTRRKNLRGAFHLLEDAKLPMHVAVIDDVMTTGTTLRECARTLKRAGVARVDVWALARAPRGRG